jgi:hypothetical protein
MEVWDLLRILMAIQTGLVKSSATTVIHKRCYRNPNTNVGIEVSLTYTEKDGRQ